MQWWLQICLRSCQGNYLVKCQNTTRKSAGETGNETAQESVHLTSYKTASETAFGPTLDTNFKLPQTIYKPARKTTHETNC